MIVGWIDVDSAPALVVVESLSRACRVSVLLFARETWRVVYVGEWDPWRLALETLQHDGAFDGQAFAGVVLDALQEWRADGGTGLARYAPGLMPAMPAAARRVGADGWLRRLGQWFAARWRALRA